MTYLSRSLIPRMEKQARLLGPDGRPIESKKDTEIPFIRYFPKIDFATAELLGLVGHPTASHFSIDRGPKVYAQAIQFLARDGRYICRITAQGEAHLVAGLTVTKSLSGRPAQKGELAIVAEEIVPNNTGAINAAVDRLVAASVRDMNRVILGEAQMREGMLQ